MWTPYQQKHIDTLEQMRAARWICGAKWDKRHCCWSASASYDLQWLTLHQRRLLLCHGQTFKIIGRTDREQIRSRINNNDCRTFRPRRPLSTAYKTVLYAVDKGLRGRNVLQSLLLILLRICSRSVRPILTSSNEPLRHHSKSSLGWAASIIVSSPIAIISRTLRSHANSLTIPQSCINAFSFYFFANAPFIWNQLPPSILQSSSLKFCLSKILLIQS